MPTKRKIWFLSVYVLLFIVDFIFDHGYVGPAAVGFPFDFAFQDCFYYKTPFCLNQFVPVLLVLDLLIPIAIYLAIGLWEARNKQ